MHTIVKCPGCERPLRIPSNAEGRTAQCPACSGTFTARSAATLPPIVALDSALADKPLPTRPPDMTPLPDRPPLRNPWEGHHPLPQRPWNLPQSSSVSPGTILGSIAAVTGLLIAILVYAL